MSAEPDVADGSGPPSARTRLIRERQRAVYDRGSIAAILDEALVCHLGFVHDGHPIVVPTLHARVGDRVYVHGSSAGRAARSLRDGAEACLTVTLLDGLVLARSAFEHSVNYRSVMVYGRIRAISDPGEKLAALRAFTEQLVPGRWHDVRTPSPKELKATAVLALSLSEASAKVRSGPPEDGEGDDAGWPAWAGELPVRQVWGEPVRDPASRTERPIPAYLRPYRRPGLDATP